MQLQAAYFLDCIFTLFNKAPEKTALNDMLYHLSFFDIEINGGNYQTDDITNVPSGIMVASNLISRGLPTRTPLFIEQLFCKVLKKTRRTTDENQAAFYELADDTSEEFKDNLFHALHIVDPRIKSRAQFEKMKTNWEDASALFETNFLFSIVPEFLGVEFMQVFEPQSPFLPLFLHAKKKKPQYSRYLDKSLPSFTTQAADFSIEFPYPIDDYNGWIVELDGKKHDQITQRQLDNLRDMAIEQAGWKKTLRIRTDEYQKLADLIEPIEAFFDNNYFQIISQNFRHPFYETKAGLDILQLALSPLAIARIQKTILHCIVLGILPLHTKKWQIAIIERDVPCGYIAIQDLKQLTDILCNLLNENEQLPEIELKIYNTKEFEDAQLNKDIDCELSGIKNFDSTKKYDLLIDISVLRRFGIKQNLPKTKSKHTVVLRSVHSIKSHKKLHACNALNYNWNEDNIKALRYLSNLCFRFDIMNTQVCAMMQKTLERKQNTMLLTPMHKQDFFALQLSALLQPSTALHISPSATVVHYYRHLLTQQKIDSGVITCIADVHCPLNLETDNTKYQLSCNQSTVQFVSMEKFHHSKVFNWLKQLIHNKKGFSYCFIDDAQCISEDNYAFHPLYAHIPDKIHYLLSDNQSIPIVVISKSQSEQTNLDIRTAFNINQQDVSNQNSVPDDIAFRIYEIEILTLNRNTEFEMAEKRISEKKQAVIPLIIKNLLSLLKKDETLNIQLLILCQTIEGYYGITDTKKKGVYDTLLNYIRHLKLGTYLGTTPQLFNHVVRFDVQQSYKNEELFRNKLLDILVAYKEFGLGMPVSGLTNILHFNLPVSIDAFTQMNDKLDIKRDEKNCYILYNRQKVQDRFEDGQLVTIDKSYQLQEHNLVFQGIVRENNCLNEFLTRIYYPMKRVVEILMEKIEHEFGLDCTISFHPENNPYLIKISHKNKLLGSLDFRYNRCVPNKENNDIAGITKLLQYSKHWIEKNHPPDLHSIRWLQEVVQLQPRNGIERILKTMNIGDTQTITIDYTNDTIDRIETLLDNYVPGKFNRRIILRVIETSTDATDFVNGLSQISNIYGKNKNYEVIERLEKLYCRIRSKAGTMKAIYRLNSIGIIDLFFIHPQSNAIVATIVKHEDSYYTGKLKHCLSRFLSSREVERLTGNIDKYEGDTLIRKCLNCLLEFIYFHVAPRQLDKINTIDTLINKAIRHKDHKKRSQYINDFIHADLYKKYTNKLINNNLYEDTGNATIANFSVIKKYVKLTDTIKENYYHLINSTEELLSNNNNNYALLLLNAYARFLTAENVNEEQKAYQMAVKGFKQYRQNESPSADAFLGKINEFINYIDKNETGLKEKIERELFFRLHTNWLTRFNAKFLEGYGKQHPIRSA